MPRSGSWWLSEFAGEKIRIECECGVSRIYDAKAAAPAGTPEEITFANLPECYELF